MSIIKRLRMSIPEQRAMEDANAKAETNKANLDYVAMMCDVEIPTEEIESEVEADE